MMSPFECEKIKKDYNVELNLPETINMDEDENLGWTLLETDEYTGYNSKQCLKDGKCIEDTSTNNKSKPFNGAIVDYNNKTGDIYSIQYTYDNTDIPCSEYELVNNVPFKDNAANAPSCPTSTTNSSWPTNITLS